MPDNDKCLQAFYPRLTFGCKGAFKLISLGAPLVCGCKFLIRLEVPDNHKYLRAYTSGASKDINLKAHFHPNVSLG